MSEIQKGELLHEGKAKKVFATNNPDLVIQEFKDSATAFDGIKKDTIASKGLVNNSVVKKLQILMVEVVIRNVATGSLVKRLGFEDGKKLDPPLVEFFLKDDSLHDPLIIDQHAILLGIANQDELNFIRDTGRKINTLMKEHFLTLGLNLIDFKLEFGRHHGEILLGDEISPDTCRLWDVATGKKLDKDRFRFDLGDVGEAYQEVLKRVTGNS
jgi:phosphoribosylaminoimidazole-succinocarboxamide synthase